MSESHDLELAERRVQDAVRALPRPSAPPAYRARLKREFVSGAIARRPSALPSRPAFAAWWVPAAAAAALFVLAYALNPGPRWTVESRGSGVAVIDGRPIPLSDRAAVTSALEKGGSVRLAQGTLELMAPRHLAIEITPGTDATLPPVERRWFGRRIQATVRSGEIRITTGQAFHGARLAVATPEARVEVTGTTLAVIRESVGTCVCVMEGRVRMGTAGSAMLAVDAGRRRFFFNDGRPPEEAEMRAAEKVALGTMHARLAARMK
jgi:ferric-dicitrate binding protein FerR (iron transport regulator)